MGVMLITGASRGIGAAIALSAGLSGWEVAVNYHRAAERARRVVDRIAEAGGRAIAVQADVGDEAAVSHMFETVDRELGRISALVNNAAGDHSAAVVDSEVADLERVLRTNLIGPWMCARAAIRRLSTARGGEGGVIVNISSISARTGGLPRDVMYAASKGALDSFTLGLAKEVGREGIRVVAVRPGITRTEIFDRSEGGLARASAIAERDTAIGRIAEPEEVAALVLWLCSPEASYVTGTLYDASGGR